MPAKPVSLQHILQARTPMTPSLRNLDSSAVGLDVGLRPPIPPTLDPGTIHQTGQMEPVFYGNSLIPKFGVGLPAMTILAQEIEPPPPPPPKPVKKKVKAVKREWKIEESIFAPRNKECDARAYYDTDGVVKRALSRDWARLLTEDRFWRFVAASDEEAAAGKVESEKELDEIRCEILKHYRQILAVFNHYAGVFTSNRGYGSCTMKVGF